VSERPQDLRVLHVERTSLVSGGERSLLDLLTMLGDDVVSTLACPPGALADDARDLGVPVLRLRGTAGSLKLHPLHTPRTVLDLAAMALQLRRRAQEVGASVIHANSIRAGLVAGATRRLGGPPVVTHVRDRLPPGRRAATALRLLERSSDRLIATSSFVAAQLRGEHVQVVPNPVRLDAFLDCGLSVEQARARLGLPRDAHVLTLVAQITPWKAQDDAIRILAGLRNRGLRALRLLLVGETKFVSAATRYDNLSFLDGLRRLARRLGVADEVSFLGERTDVPELLRASDLLLVPSWEEPFGRTVLEGMAAGTPVLATDVGGPTEILRDGRDGLLLPPRCPDRWTEAAEALLRDPARRATLAAAGRAAVEGRHSPARRIGEIAAIYRRLSIAPKSVR
jgi:L-malate glycosyltransferase